MCVVSGRKFVRLFNPRDSEYLYPRGDNATWLPVDLLTESMEGFDLYKKATAMDVILRPGDCLFIPRGWWHFVKSLELSANVAVFF